MRRTSTFRHWLRQGSIGPLAQTSSANAYSIAMASWTISPWSIQMSTWNSSLQKPREAPSGGRQTQRDSSSDISSWRSSCASLWQSTINVNALSFWLTGYLENRNANQEQAITFSFDSHIMPFFKTFDLTNFRQAKMYNEGVDIVIKKHLQVLQDVYKKFSGREVLGGEERYMSLAEFVDLVTST